MDEQTEMIAGLDLGHSKVAVVVGRMTADGVSIVGAGSHPSKGLRRGAIINMASVVESIQKAVQETQALYGIKLDSVNVSLSGSEITGIRGSGTCRVQAMEVSPTDVEKAIDATMSVAIPLDREVIHLIPQDFTLDNQEGIESPVGMSGFRLEVKTYTVTAPVSQAHAVLKCCNQSGLRVSDIVLDQLASAASVLTDDERRSGVVLIDLGSESTKLVIYTSGFPAHIAALSVGSVNISNDIAVGLRISPQLAEEVKKKDGCALKSLIELDETITVPDFNGKGPRDFASEVLVEIIHKRAREILLWAREEMVKSGVEAQSISSVVLTGGGSLLKGLPELASGIFERGVRVGAPQGIAGQTHLVQDPSYATAAGLVLRGFAERRRQGSA